MFPLLYLASAHAWNISWNLNYLLKNIPLLNQSDSFLKFFFRLFKIIWLCHFHPPNFSKYPPRSLSRSSLLASIDYCYLHICILVYIYFPKYINATCLACVILLVYRLWLLKARHHILPMCEFSPVKTKFTTESVHSDESNRYKATYEGILSALWCKWDNTYGYRLILMILKKKWWWANELELLTKLLEPSRIGRR